MSKALQIKRFDVSSMKENASILIIGRTRTGKTTLKRYLFALMSDRKPFNLGIHLGGTIEAKKGVEEIFPKSLILDYNLEKFKKCWNSIKEEEKNIKQQGFKTIFDLDDVGFDKKLFKTSEFRDFGMNGRNLNCCRVTCVQYPVDMPPEIREQYDYVFVTRCASRDTADKLHKYYFGSVIPKKDAFLKVLKACTQNYEVLVYDRTVSDDADPSKCLFFIKADPTIKRKLCDEKYWKLSDYIEQHGTDSLLEQSLKIQHTDRVEDPLPTLTEEQLQDSRRITGVEASDPL